MSIFVWRTWHHNFLDKYGLVQMNLLHGHYFMPWQPKEVKQANCYAMGGMRLVEDKTLPRNARYSTVPIPLHERNESPMPDCSCGIYGYKCEYVPEEIQQRFEVLGVAEIWGKIIEAELGYRAQYAQLRALVNAPVLARIYAVPNLPTVDYAKKEYFS
jgi:hypothetical protein